MADVEANLRAKVTVDGAKQGTVELNNLANAGDKAGKKLNLMDKFVGSANKALNYLAVGMENLNLSYEKGDISLDSYSKKVDKLSNSMSRLQKIARGTSDTFNQVGKTQQTYAQIAGSNTREAAQANRFNTGNIAAQFQDIAVTSAMNMNPLTIGLQQGTQLAYVLGQSKAPLADFAAGVKNLISPVTLLSVGLTALVAVGIQMVNWVNVGKSTLNGLASAFDWVAENASKLTVALVGFIALNSVKVINSFTKGVISLSNCLITATFNTLKFIGAWIVSNPLGAIVVGLTAIISVLNELGYVSKDTFNKFIGYTLAAGYAIGGIFDAIAQGFTKGFDKSFEDYQNKLSELVNEDYLGKLDNGIKTVSKAASESLTSISKGLGENDKDAKKLQKTIDDSTNSYKDLIASGWEKVEDMKFEQSIQGMSEYDRIVKTTTRDLTQQVELIRSRAAAEGIELPILKNYQSEIDRIAKATAEVTIQKNLDKEAQDAWNATMDYSASLTKGYFSDLKSGLQEGQSAWEAFTNAVIKMLDKISDKMMDMAIDVMFDGLKQGQVGKSNNWMSTAVNAVASAFTGGSSGDMFATKEFASTVGIKPAIPAAQGGVFSNGIYSSPTMFKFAKGGKFGVMGEAGPEAVMPLHRSPDGSLGVRADGMGGGSPVTVNVINNSKAQARTQERQTEQGTTIDVIIDEMVAQKLGQQGTASNQALTAYNNRQLTMR